jgi:formyltetrahydrofolate deformylase
MSTAHILRADCKDRPGIVARVAQCLFENGCTIEEAGQFNDHLSGHFFMRVAFRPVAESSGVESFRWAFSEIASDFAMDWSLHDSGAKARALILVSTEDHCLHDILYRVKSGLLPLEIAAIASNHAVLRPLAEMHGIPFHHLPVTAGTRAEQEGKLARLAAESGAELIVLARYMQILSDAFCAAHEGRIINIHHSFLPGFKGAKPYHQAHARGVKLIGATAHFVTKDLDEGPIIEQETTRVDHSQGPERLRIIGKDIESRVLSRALSFFAERRIFLHGGHTVIL